jgi:hypothetical protein
MDVAMNMTGACRRIVQPRRRAPQAAVGQPAAVMALRLGGVISFQADKEVLANLGIGAEAAQTVQSANSDKITFKNPKIRARPCPAARHDSWHQVTPRGHSCPSKK